MSGNTINVQGSYIDIHDNENVYLSVDKAKVNVNENENTEQARADESSLSVCRAKGVSTGGQNDNGQPDVTALVACVERVREFMWSDSALAVVFCVCRDCYGYANNMSQFERDFNCHDGLLSNTFRSNPYMRLNIRKWEQQGVKRRVLRLMDAYRNAVEERLTT